MPGLIYNNNNGNKILDVPHYKASLCCWCLDLSLWGSGVGVGLEYRRMTSSEAPVTPLYELHLLGDWCFFFLMWDCRTLLGKTWCRLMTFLFILDVTAQSAFSPLLPNRDWPTPDHQREVTSHGRMVSASSGEWWLGLALKSDAGYWMLNRMPHSQLLEQIVQTQTGHSWLLLDEVGGSLRVLGVN